MSNNIFESKRFWSTVTVLVAMVIVSFFPELERAESAIAENLEMIVLTLVAGYTITDAIKLLPKVVADIMVFLANRSNEG